MEAIQLRAHHLLNLRTYHVDGGVKEWVAEVYGEEFVRAAEGVFSRVLSGESPVTVTDTHDYICAFCRNRMTGGCRVDDIWYAGYSISLGDEEKANELGIRIGVTYDSHELLRRIGILKKDAELSQV